MGRPAHLRGNPAFLKRLPGLPNYPSLTACQVAEGAGFAVAMYEMRPEGRQTTPDPATLDQADETLTQQLDG